MPLKIKKGANQHDNERKLLDELPYFFIFILFFNIFEWMTKEYPHGQKLWNFTFS